MSWKFALATLDGKSVGEPTAYGRRVSLGISRVNTFGFRIKGTDQCCEALAAGSSMIKVYDSAGGLITYGPVIGDDEEGSAGKGVSVQVAGADLAWRFGKRYVAKDLTGVGTSYNTDSGSIAHAGLTEINTEDATGVLVGNKDAFVSRSVTYLWKRYLDELSELGAIEGSYEWGLRYVDGGAATAPDVYLDLLSRLGQDRTSTVFLEYGTGRRNCSAYQRARTIDQLATDVWVLGGGGTTIVAASNAAARAGYGRHEDVINYGDIASAALLDALAAAHVAIRRKPRQIWSLTPFAKKAPKYGVDYVVGDLVSARIVARGRTLLSGTVRIWGVDIEIDELGNERPTLKLTSDL